MQRRSSWGCLCAGLAKHILNVFDSPQYQTFKVEVKQVCTTYPESMEAEIELLAAPPDSPPEFLSTRGSLLTGEYSITIIVNTPVPSISLR